MFYSFECLPKDFRVTCQKSIGLSYQFQNLFLFLSISILKIRILVTNINNRLKHKCHWRNTPCQEWSTHIYQLSVLSYDSCGCKYVGLNTPVIQTLMSMHRPFQYVFSVGSLNISVIGVHGAILFKEVNACQAGCRPPNTHILRKGHNISTSLIISFFH